MRLFDTCVILDAFETRSPWHNQAIKSIYAATRQTDGAINSVVLAELCAGARDPQTVIGDVLNWGLNILDVPAWAAMSAGRAYAVYLQNRQKSGNPPPGTKMPLPDFFIGAHAEIAAYSLITRDENRFKTYFPSVNLIPL